MKTIYLIILFLPCYLFAQVTPNDGDWSKQYVFLKNTAEADYMVRVGDIDNLGFSFGERFNPFCGFSTDAHFFPWDLVAGDHPGTDMIMIGTSYRGEEYNPCGQDGYSGASNPVKTLVMPLKDIQGASIKSAMLQLFVDDFQAPVHCTKFRAWANGYRWLELEKILNTLEQSGPIGKVVSIKFPDYLLPALSQPNFSLNIDDSTTHAGDGFAIDFMKLLINPKPSGFCKGNINGIVQDAETFEPIAGAVVRTLDGRKFTTDAEGRFTVKDLQAGLNFVEAGASGYVTAEKMLDAIEGEPFDQFIFLNKNRQVKYNQQTVSIGSSLVLNNIQFAQAKYDLSTEAKAELDKIVAFLRENEQAEIELSGHTSSEGAVSTNQVLSQNRVQACKNYIVSKGIAEKRIFAVGYGSLYPIASNDSEANRAKNRRVEMKITKL